MQIYMGAYLCTRRTRYLWELYITIYNYIWVHTSVQGAPDIFGNWFIFYMYYIFIFIIYLYLYLLFIYIHIYYIFYSYGCIPLYKEHQIYPYIPIYIYLCTGSTRYLWELEANCIDIEKPNGVADRRRAEPEH